MANTYTGNLNLTKPEVGADTNAWGGHLNTDLDALDAIFAAGGNGTSVGLNVGTGKALTLAGTGSVSGTLNVPGTLNVSGSINITGTLSGAAFAGYATLTGTQTLTNKTLTAPTIATIMNVGALTLPSGPDTLVCRTATETLTNKTLAAPTFTGAATFPSASVDGSGNATFVSITDAIGNVRTVPQNAQSSGYTLQASDNGKFINITSGSVTVPSGIFTAGQSVTVFNNSGSNLTVTQGSGVTMRLAGMTATGDRTLANYGLCTLLCTGTNAFVATGAGLR